MADQTTNEGDHRALLSLPTGFPNDQNYLHKTLDRLICGDVLFTPETVRRIEQLRHTAAPSTRTVPLYDFTEAKSA